jgi:hypothetical protein
LAFKARRIVRGLAWGCALLLGAGLIASCAPPQYRYISDSNDHAYFKVPHYWQQVSPADLCKVLEQQASSRTCPAGWDIAYEAGQDPSALDFPALDLSRPFVYSEVAPYTPQNNTPLTAETLQDFFLPFTAAERAAAEESGDFPLTDFKQLRDATVTLHGGFYGFRETFDYSIPGGPANTFDEDILTNAAGTTIYFLVVHCTASCYSQDQTAINEVMSSFTVRSQ